MPRTSVASRCARRSCNGSAGCVSDSQARIEPGRAYGFDGVLGPIHEVDDSKPGTRARMPSWRAFTVQDVSTPSAPQPSWINKLAATVGWWQRRSKKKGGAEAPPCRALSRSRLRTGVPVQGDLRIAPNYLARVTRAVAEAGLVAQRRDGRADEVVERSSDSRIQGIRR